MATKEARLVMRLVDQVSGPAKAVQAALTQMNNSMAAMRNVTLLPMRALDHMARDFRRRSGDLAGLSAGLSFSIARVGRNVYELEKSLNWSTAAGDLSLKQRANLLDAAVNLNREYAATATQIVEGANETLKSGFNFDQTIGSLRGILDTAQAMDVPIAEASGAIVTAMVAQKMAMDTVQSSMKSSIRMADLYAYAMKETAKASLEDFTTSGKYFNPVAAAIGMSPGETMAFQIALAKAGIFGSSAGTGLRAAPVRIAAPSKKARQAFARLGINPQDFVGKRLGSATGDTIAAALESVGFSTDGIEAGIDQLLANPKLARSPAKLANAIIKMFGDELGVATGEDRTILATSIQNALTAGASEVDLLGVLKALRDKGAGVADYAAIFGLQHASKMQAIDIETLEHYLREVDAAAVGTAERMRKQQMHGIVKSWNEFTAAVDKMMIKISASGLLSDAVASFARMADSISRLADTNPEFLRFAGYTALALASAAPLGLAISGVAAAAALLVNPLTWVVAGLGYLAAINWRPLTQFFQSVGKVFTSKLRPDIVRRVGDGLDRIKRAFSGLDSDGYNVRWAKAADAVGTALADLTNRVYGFFERFSQTKFATGFVKGVGDALDNMAAAGRKLIEVFDQVEIRLQPVLDFLDTEFAGTLGEISGQALMYGAGLTIAAGGVIIMAGALRRLAGALYLLSGAKVGMSLLGAMLGLTGGGGKGGGKSGASKLGQLRGKGGLGAVLGILGGGAGLGGLMYLLKDFQGGVWNLKPPQARNSALADFLEKVQREAKLARALQSASRTKDDDIFAGLSRAERDAARTRTGGERPLHPSLMNENLLKDSSKPGFDWKRFFFGAAADPNFKIRDAFRIELDGVKSDSSSAGQEIKSNLEVTARPLVDTSSIDAAIARAGTLRSLMNSANTTLGAAVARSYGGSQPTGPAFGGPRAAGGPVRRGMVYSINEKGRETVTMGTNGYVTPAHRVGGSSAPLIGSVHIHEANADKVMAKLDRTLRRALSRSKQIELDGRTT